MDFRKLTSNLGNDLLLDLDQVCMITPDGKYCYVLLKSGIEVHLKQSYDEVCNMIFGRMHQKQYLKE